jgi:hypothetical protein
MAVDGNRSESMSFGSSQDDVSQGDATAGGYGLEMTRSRVHGAQARRAAKIEDGEGIVLKEATCPSLSLLVIILQLHTQAQADLLSGLPFPPPC